MSFQRLVTMNLVALLLALTLGGIVVRGRLRLCRSFVALLAATLSGNILIQTLPGRFWTWSFWMAKETSYAVLYMATAIELGSLLFAGLPRVRARLIPALVGLAAAAALTLRGVPDFAHETVAGVVVATLNAAAAWLFALVIAAAFYYHLPIHPYHRGILAGAGLHLSVYSALLGILGTHGEFAAALFSALDPAVFATAVAIWMWTAWQPERASDMPPELQAVLQPWAVRA